jgi:CDP-diglyceride synthetase
LRDWRGIAVAILSAGITISLILFTISAMVNDEPAPQWLSYLIFTLFGAVIGVVASYVRHVEDVKNSDHH